MQAQDRLETEQDAAEVAPYSRIGALRGEVRDQPAVHVDQMHDLAVGPAQRGQRVAATEKIGDLRVDGGFFPSLVRQQLLLQQPVELAQLGPDAFALPCWSSRSAAVRMRSSKFCSSRCSRRMRSEVT